ncbi:SulP family inorganic anion transporter [Nocardioides sp.]|uniref:SulP family inorganic anion transporter n=1 Tax=Nocardioides sp. TaxID=35761 RepID=UPI00261905EC|nr:SulP family inorganic anion transporter [Nocardioides sp.]
MSVAVSRPLDVATALRSPAALRTEILGGLVVALALIPEAISFSVIAHVDPRIGLFASVTMAITISFVGGRPAMISAATGAVALVIAPVAKTYGLDYLIATVLLAGVFQIVLGLLQIARLMRYVPRSVMVGFVNALGILLAWAQWDNLHDVPWLVYPLVIATIVTIWGLPKLTRAVPSPLVAIVVLTAVTWAAGAGVPTVSDKGELPDSLPPFGLPDVPWTWDTLSTIAPYALGMALVGLMESLMTATLVDDLTDSRSDKRRESCGQGVANIVTGLFGGMGGCAMIGQTMINVRQSGARTRISTFLAGAFLLVLLLALGDVVGHIPMAALAGVMIMVAVATFDWHSLRTLRRMPRSETAVMVVTVVVVVATDNLSIGVVAGVVVACLLFARRVAHLVGVERHLEEGGAVARYVVTGSLFFASSNDLYRQFDYAGDPDRVEIDVSGAHIWDASTVAALDAVRTKYGRVGTEVGLRGLNPESAAMIERLSGHLVTEGK